MPLDATYAAAWLVGLLGGVHCVGMCGPVAGALAVGLPETLRGRPLATLPYLLAFNAGRLLSYAAAGALLGGFGFLAARLVAVSYAQQLLQGIAALFMAALGLYLAGWWTGLARIEQAGGALWRRLQPLGRRLLPVTKPRAALLLGMLWGWLPCGLVYSVLAWAIASGSAARGALLMLSFGLGTLPTLIGLGAAAGQLASWLRRPWLRGTAGAMLIVLAAAMLWRVLPWPAA